MKTSYISVAGTMGVGKTTLVKIIAKEFDFTPVLENFADNPFLPLFYKDMKRWSFHSQTFFLLEKIRQIEHISRSILFSHGKGTVSGIVQDTPIYEDVFSYAKALYQMKNMSRDEWRLYLGIYETCCRDMKYPDLIIYLSCPIEFIYERIMKRNRTFESLKKKEFVSYLRLLDRLNREWLKKIGKKTEIFILDTYGNNYVVNKRKKINLIEKLSKYLV